MKKHKPTFAANFNCRQKGPLDKKVCKLCAWALFLFCYLAVTAGARAESPSAATVIDDCRYASDAAARTAWKPKENSLPVSTAVVDSRNALRLPCDFSSNPATRAYWDRSVNLNLADCDGVQFKFFCRNTLPVSSFAIHFQSGDGWYSADFFPESADGWNTITINKSAMKAEGQPAGWGQIKTIRISAWRGRQADAEFYLSDLRKPDGLGDGESVIILKSDWSARQWPGQAASFEQSAKIVALDLRASGIASATISDNELTRDQLALARLVVLPQNPALPDRAVNLLTDYARQGGKFLVFYTLPGQLRPALNLEGGDQIKAPHPGAFARIQFEENALPGAPVAVVQNSGNISSLQPIPGAGRVLANWLDADGKPAGHPAIIATSNCLAMTHVLLPGDDENKARMLLALVGALVPDLGRQSAEASIARIGQLASFSNYEDAAAQITKLDTGRRAAKALASAAALRDAARELSAEKKYGEAMEKAAEAGKELKFAFCLAQQPLPGEFRAFWCHSALGVPGMDWDEAIHRLAENGFTAIIPNMLSGGVAYYPSKVLPTAAAVAEHGDQVRQCLAACRKYGVQLHVWKVDWNLMGAPKEFADKMRDEHRLQMSSKGNEELWLCPSHPDNQKLEIAAMLELVRNYDLDGIHFDYIRYPGNDYCFCDGCKDRFQHASGALVHAWPADVMAGGPLHQQWLDWRRDNITTVVKAVSEQAHALKPNLKISAAVFRYWNVDRDSVGQDWKLWCDRGYLDFVCPMDYTPSKLRFEDMVSQQVKWAGKVPCYPGLGASASSSHFGADRACEEIGITRRYKTGGFVIFNYGVNEAQELLPQLGAGITRIVK